MRISFVETEAEESHDILNRNVVGIFRQHNEASVSVIDIFRFRIAVNFLDKCGEHFYDSITGFARIFGIDMRKIGDIHHAVHHAVIQELFILGLQIFIKICTVAKLGKMIGIENVMDNIERSA